MKIGTMTFHWATNYGAVLQSYALQKYLELNGFDSEIINYLPFRNKFIQSLSNLRRLRISELVKEERFKNFRKQFLTVSKEIYFTNNGLVRNCNKYEVYICGSDQVWNESFVLHSEKKPNLSYYLNFAGKNFTRISYATSFGTNKLSPEVIDLVKPELINFDYIGVRENTGKEIVERIGLNAKLVVDPTLLLEKNIYESLICDFKAKHQFQLFSYILHSNQSNASQIDEYIFKTYFEEKVDRKFNLESVGVIDWLYYIRNSRFVLTNSFHGTVFAIIFNKPFIVIPVENSGMNDRIITLLKQVGLENRIIESLDIQKLDILMEETINWKHVNGRVEKIRNDSAKFLIDALKSIMSERNLVDN